MRAFAALLDGLTYSQSRERKMALLARYCHDTPDPDRGWALAALTNGVPARLALRRGLLDLPGRAIDPLYYGYAATTSATRLRPSRCCGQMVRLVTQTSSFTQ